MHDIGRIDNDNGYLSDVPPQFSNVPSDSEASQREAFFMVNSNNVMKAYKQKYDFLREAYEDRIKKLSETIESGFSNYLTDEILRSMTEHNITSAYVHRHLVEVFNDHLKNEREKYIHVCIAKSAALESELKNVADTNAANVAKIQKLMNENHLLKQDQLAIEPLRKMQSSLESKIIHLEKQFASDKRELQVQNENLQLHNNKTTEQLTDALNLLESLKSECEAYRSDNISKTLDINRLEQTMGETSAQLVELAKEEAYEKDLIPKLQEKILELTQNRESYVQ